MREKYPLHLANFWKDSNLIRARQVHNDCSKATTIAKTASNEVAASGTPSGIGLAMACKLMRHITTMTPKWYRDGLARYLLMA